MKTIFAFAVTKRPQRATSVLSRAASESSSGRRNGTFSRSILWPSSRSTAIRSEFAISTVVRTPSAAADPELRHEVEPEEGEAGDRDRDRQAGEEHRPAGGRARLGRRVDGRETLVQQPA